MRITLIGPGDFEYHFYELMGWTKEKLKAEINILVEALVKKDVEVALLPDRGISLEIAKLYKEKGGRKVVALVPQDDEDFGIKHLQPYLQLEVDGKKLFDEIINTGNWYKHDMTMTLFGDKLLMLGNSLGTMGELTYGFYIYKLFQRHKKGVEVLNKDIHPDIRIGKDSEFAAFLYKPFFKQKLSPELEDYIEKTGGKLFYLEKISELS